MPRLSTSLQRVFQQRGRVAHIGQLLVGVLGPDLSLRELGIPLVRGPQAELEDESGDQAGTHDTDGCPVPGRIRRTLLLDIHE